MPVPVQIGLLHTGSEAVFKDLVQQTIIAANTWLDKNAKGTTVELHPDRTRYADDDLDKLEDQASELADGKNPTEIILAAGGPQSALAARDATEDTNPTDFTKRKPVVFTTVTDPVTLGLRKQLPKPGGTNLVGTAGETSEKDPDRLALLHSFIDAQGLAGDKVGVLINPLRELNHELFEQLKVAAQGLKLKLTKRMPIRKKGIQNAYRAFRKRDAIGAVVTADSFFNNNRDTIIKAAADNKIPSIYQWKWFVTEGGLMSFGPKIEDAYVQAGTFLGMLAKEKPEDRQPSTIDCAKAADFELWVNKDTADDLKFENFPAMLEGIKVNYIG